MIYTPKKTTWQWKHNHLKMYLLLKMLMFHCYVRFRGALYILDFSKHFSSQTFVHWETNDGNDPRANQGYVPTYGIPWNPWMVMVLFTCCSTCLYGAQPLRMYLKDKGKMEAISGKCIHIWIALSHTHKQKITSSINSPLMTIGLNLSYSKLSLLVPLEVVYFLLNPSV